MITTQTWKLKQQFLIVIKKNTGLASIYAYYGFLESVLGKLHKKKKDQICKLQKLPPSINGLQFPIWSHYLAVHSDLIPILPL